MENFINNLIEQAAAYAPKVVGAILTLIIGFWVIARITKLLSKYFKKKSFDETVEPFLLSVVSVGLKVLLLLAVAQMFGIETTSFVAIFGALAFAIGLALQGNLSHMAAGILILIFRPFKVGDFIVAQGYSGNRQRNTNFYHSPDNAGQPPDHHSLMAPSPAGPSRT
jgi:small conductance mechanosensitive channel